jgi:hypothetical protein
MTPSLTFACLWVVAASITAMLPMRRQMVPGLAILIAAPPLLVWLAVDTGPWWALAGFLAILSFMRRPLIYFARKALGWPVDDPRRSGEGHGG